MAKSHPVFGTLWTVVLEKTLESPLDCKEIQPVHSEGDQPWDFFGRNDAEAETLVLWPPHVKSWLIGKDSDAGRDWGQEEKGTTEDEMAGWHHWLDGRESEWTQELVMDREAWRAAIHGVTESWTRLSDWTELNWIRKGREEAHWGYFAPIGKVTSIPASKNNTITIKTHTKDKQFERKTWQIL